MLHYHGGPVNGPRLALGRQGVTFDSGGLSLKTPDNMLTHEMRHGRSSNRARRMVAIGPLEVANQCQYVCRLGRKT